MTPQYLPFSPPIFKPRKYMKGSPDNIISNIITRVHKSGLSKPKESHTPRNKDIAGFPENKPP